MTTFKLVTNEKYNIGSGTIHLSISNINNPDLGTTDGFSINTYYDSLNLDTTNEDSLVSRTFTTVAKADKISVKQVSFYPKNEAEEATYKFTFVPSNLVETSMYIVIQFPSDYDPLLGRAIACEQTAGLVGTVTCFASERGIYIENFETYIASATNPISIVIYGIINPNKQSSLTGYFQIGTMVKSTLKFMDLNAEAAALSFLAAPGWAYLYNVSATNLYTRWESSYDFVFKASKSIPKTSMQGFVFFDFPPQFEVDDQVSTF